jgi:hypothetical protein
MTIRVYTDVCGGYYLHYTPNLNADKLGDKPFLNIVGRYSYDVRLFGDEMNNTLAGLRRVPLEELTPVAREQLIAGLRGESLSACYDAVHAYQHRRAVRAVAFATRKTREVYTDYAELGVVVRAYVNDLRRYDAGKMAFSAFHVAADYFVDAMNDFELPRVLASRIMDKINTDYEVSDGAVYCHCGHFDLEERTTTTGRGRAYCGNCTDEHLVWVESAGEHAHRDDVYRWESDNEYHYEPEPYDDDDDSSSGLATWGSSTAALSHDRSFRSAPLGDFIMGVELEVESNDSDDRSEHVEACDSYFNSTALGHYAMFKEDGSLSETRGFEIVTAARRLPDHLQMFSAWRPRGMTAWDNGHCGMHVHIDSRAFTALTLGKLLLFINTPANAEFIRKIAGRHPDRDEQAQHYARALHQDYVAAPNKALKGDNTSRYYMVNLTNLTHAEARRLSVENLERACKGDYSTVELRLFRASLSKARLLAQLEFAHAAVMFCRTASWQKLTGAAFLAWLGETRGMYPALAKWFSITPRTRQGESGREVLTAQPAEV